MDFSYLCGTPAAGSLWTLICFITVADAGSLSQADFLGFLTMLFSELCYFYCLWSMFLWSVVLGMWVFVGFGVVFGFFCSPLIFLELKATVTVV